MFVLLSLKMVSPALPGNSICCLSSNCCACDNSFVFFLLLALVVVFVHVGHADGDDSCHCHVERATLDSCAGQQNIAVCVHCTHVAEIDALAAIVIVVG